MLEGRCLQAQFQRRSAAAHGVQDCMVATGTPMLLLQPAHQLKRHHVAGA